MINITSFDKTCRHYNISGDIKNKLSQNLTRISVGNDEVLTSPLAIKRSPSDILSGWSKVFNENTDKMDDPSNVLLNLEISQKDKFGPRSISLPWKKWKGTFYSTFDNDIKVPNDVLISNVDHYTSKFRNRLRPISGENSIKRVKNSTSSGLPSLTRKGYVKDKTLLNLKTELGDEYPAVLYTRSQEQLKIRGVWGYPLSDIIRETKYFVPLLEFQKRLNWRSALNGPDAVSSNVTRIINLSLKNGLSLVSVDFSSYDTTVRKKLQEAGFHYVMRLFQDKESPEITKIRDRFNSIGIITPDGLVKGDHGVPSGSNFTNEIDSIVQRTIAMSSGLVKDGHMDIQGDDGVYAVDPDKVVSFMKSFSTYGLSVNESKSYVSSDYVVYLQNLFHKHYENNGLISGIYPTYRALNRIIYQERWSNFEDYSISGKDYYSIRTITILENCKHHPLFKELVRYVLSLDKYNLKFSTDGLKKYVDMIFNTEGSSGVIINQYGDDLRGIRNFATVKLINNMS